MRDRIEPVPTLRPTEEEFKRPLEYFKKLRDVGRLFGIVKIVTPESWRPTELPKTEETFDSFRQKIHSLKTGCIFGTGDDYTESSFMEYADLLREKWVKSHPALELDLSAYAIGDAMMKEKFSEAAEEAYWDMVEGRSTEKMEVDYCSNHAVIRSDERTDPWNLSSLLNEEGNLLKLTGLDIPGVTRPWRYFGCLFSTFCWHVEDHFMYSANYHHAGAPKIWYGIPASGADAFEAYITSSVSTRSMKSDILNRLTMMVSPYAFPSSIPVYKTVQTPGDLILTFPRAFHGGYNEGWNCAEAVNFALMDWVVFGHKAVQRYLSVNCEKEALFSHDKLLWMLIEKAKHDAGNGEKDIPSELRKAVMDSCKEEIEKRAQIRAQLYKVKEAVPPVRWSMDDETWTCSESNAPLFFSYLSCACRINKAKVLSVHAALQPGAFKCGCVPYLCLERTDDEISDMMQTVQYKEEDEDEAQGATNVRSNNKPV